MWRATARKSTSSPRPPAESNGLHAYGDRIEVLKGLNEGATIIANPSDVARDGRKTDVVLARPPGGK
jgi:hypothetical protein